MHNISDSFSSIIKTNRHADVLRLKFCPFIFISFNKSLAFSHISYLYSTIIGVGLCMLRGNNAGCKWENENSLKDTGRLRCAQPSEPHAEQEELLPHGGLRNPVTIWRFIAGGNVQTPEFGILKLLERLWLLSIYETIIKTWKHRHMTTHTHTHTI